MVLSRPSGRLHRLHRPQPQSGREADFIIPPVADDAIEFSWRIDGDVATVLRLVVHGERRKGRGRATYTDWEASLPATVSRINLWSKNADATRFWKAMGFINPHNFANEDGSCSMSKSLDE